MEEKKKHPCKYKKKPNGKNDTGRPTLMTPETLQKLEVAFKMGCSATIACQHAGISRTCLYKYQNDNPDFDNKMKQWQINPILKAQNNVMKILNGARTLMEKKKDKATGEELDEDPRAELTSKDVLELSKWYLEHRNKAEYGSRLEITGADGEEIRTSSGIAEMLALREKVKQMSDEAKEQQAEDESK